MGTELHGAGGYRVGDADRNRTADLLKEAHAAGYLTWRRPTSGSAPRWPPAPAASWTSSSPTCHPKSGGPVGNRASGQPGRHRASAPASRRRLPGWCRW